MSGYNAVFNGMFQGTLFGRWPDGPVFATMLALADKNGEVDMTPQAIAGMTGWPLELLMEGIQKLLLEDPDSRYKEHGGRRLLLMDSRRAWGWKIASHGHYREKARKMGSDAARAASGENRERMALRRSDKTREDPLSDTDTDTDTTGRGAPTENKPQPETAAASPPPPPDRKRRSSAKQNGQLFPPPPKPVASRRMPEDFEISPRLRSWFRNERFEFSLDKELEAIRDYEFKTAHNDWEAVVRTWCRREGKRITEGARRLNGGGNPNRPKGVSF